MLDPRRQKTTYSSQEQFIFLSYLGSGWCNDPLRATITTDTYDYIGCEGELEIDYIYIIRNRLYIYRYTL